MEDVIMAISLPDARQMSDEVLQALRLRALRGCQLGYSETELAQLLGVARETICHWWSAYADGGLDAIPHDRSGRPPGSGRSLDERHAQQIQAAIDTHVPEELGVAATLWTRRAVQELIHKWYGLRMPLRTVGEYLRRWGYTPKRPRRRARRQDRVEVQEWLDKTYPAIKRRAAREGAEIHWGDETGGSANEHPGRGYARVGQAAEMKVSGERFRVNMVSTITNGGKVRFMTYTSTLTAAVFVLFLQRLLRGARKKIFLILDRQPAQEAAAVAAWVSQQGGRVELLLAAAACAGAEPG
jgi:transposase